MAHPKGVLIERLQKDGQQPRFETRVSGPDHEPVFDAEVQVGGDVLGRGSGPNKRTAERRAAEEALAALDDSDGVAGAAESAAADAAEALRPADGLDDDADEPDFEGPWPIFESVLATSLRIAHERVDAGRRGAAAREDIESFALELYKNVLQDLGDVVELDD